MPRPKKWRNVCCMPNVNRFGPLNNNSQENIVMTIEEYEAIRLIDFEGLKQEESAEHMHVARTTFQGIYDSARKKLANSLVNGKILIIKGGDYMLCDGMGLKCSGKGCHRNMCENRGIK